MNSFTCRRNEGERAMIANVNYNLILIRKKERRKEGMMLRLRLGYVRIIRLRFCGAAVGSSLIK